MHEWAGHWTPEEAAEVYGIAAWGRGYFRVYGRSTVEVLPDQRSEGAVDVLEIVEGDVEEVLHDAVQAYEEVHNFFGDTQVLHINMDEKGRWTIEELIEADTVHEVLRYVQFDPDALLSRLRRDVERTMREGQLALNEGRQLVHFYQEGLNGYSYLEEG